MAEQFSTPPKLRLTPEMILSCRKLLQINETAYVLNMPKRVVRSLIYEGELRCTKKFPVRIPVQDVKDFLEGRAA